MTEHILWACNEASRQAGCGDEGWNMRYVEALYKLGYRLVDPPDQIPYPYPHAPEPYPEGWRWQMPKLISPMNAATQLSRKSSETSAASANNDQIRP